MKISTAALILMTFFFQVSQLPAVSENCLVDDLFIGPEIYYVKRTKEDGGEQTGTLFGLRVGIDHIKGRRFYWGADFLWAEGNLEGKSKDLKIKSQLTDANIELRLGYTFQTNLWKVALWTPFVGLGYFQEKNFYRHPSPLTVHFDNQFTYIPFGFLSEIFFTPSFSAGLNVKVRYLLDGDQKVSHDSEHANVIQCYNEELQYRVELPFTGYFCWGMQSTAVSLSPFYEYREFGHRANFPFDFYATEFRLYGATLKLFYFF